MASHDVGMPKRKSGGGACYKMKCTFTGKKRRTFGISGKAEPLMWKAKRVLFVSIWVRERDDRSVISSVGPEAQCNN